MVCRPGRCSSQTRFRFARAATDLGVWPATYRSNVTTSSGSGDSTTADPVRSGTFCMGLASGCCALIGLATPRHRGPVALAPLLEQVDFLGRPGGLFADRLELAPQRRELGLDRGAPPLQIAP